LENPGVAEVNNLPNKILLIDDDPSVGTALENALARYKISVVKASDLETAIYKFNQERFDVVIVELEFGPLPGLALIQKWRAHEVLEKRLTGFIVAASSQRNMGQDNLAREMTDIEIVVKPIKDVQLLSIMAKALDNKKRSAVFVDTKTRVIDPHLKLGNVQKALDRTTQLIPEVGNKAERLLLKIYEDSIRWQECLDATLKLLIATPNDINLISTAGRMNMRLGKFEEAKPYLERADSLAPQNIERLNEIATLYLQTKHPEKSVGVFKELIKLNPESPDYKFDAFKMLYDAGFDEHAVDFGKETAKPMEIVRHYNNKGVMLSKAGNVSEALVEYKRAIQFYPKFKDNFRIYYNMALAHLTLKTPTDFAQAESYFKKALELDPTFDKAKAGLSNLQKLAAK
jgi:tetratricopeptide (TPR) repeat protein